MSEEKYVIVVNTPEEVAYKLMHKIRADQLGKTFSEQETLELYARCLKTVQGQESV